MANKRSFRHRLKKFLRWGSICFLILLGICMAPLLGVAVKCDIFSEVTPLPQDASGLNTQITGDLAGYARSEEQTYLTLPEWYIVYSSEEYAAFIADTPPSHFPYFQAIIQYWSSYYKICDVTQDRYAFNSRYHTILSVIGVSFTLENSAKGLYEKTIGRITEWLSSSDLTEEDRYAQQVAVEYGAFLHTIPWFEFPFDEKLAGLWAETDWWGPNVIRKWERKLALTVEYGFKSFYAGLIKGGNEASFKPVDLEIYVWAEGLTDEVRQQEPDIQIVKTLDEAALIATLPRYEAFTNMLPRLVANGVEFVEIAGNDEILITIIANQQWNYDLEAGEVLFEMPILSEPGLKRTAISVPVRSLHTVLLNVAAENVLLEHIYDY